MEIDIKKKLVKNWFKVLQDTICFDIEEIEKNIHSSNTKLDLIKRMAKHLKIKLTKKGEKNT